MKKIKNISIWAIIISSIILTGFTSCNSESDLVLPRLFRPVNFNVETNKTIATFSWAKTDNAASYTLQVSTDSVNYSNPDVDTTLTDLSLVKELAGETKYYARIKANDADTTKNSLFNVISFSTPAENIFSGYGTNNNSGKLYSAYMTDVNTLDIKWQPAANVTHLILTSADESQKDSLVITGAEATAGEKIVSGLSNSKWTVKIYNSKRLRGTTTGIVEGDIVLNSGDDLPTAITNATDGQVILLAAGATYQMGGGTFRFDKSVKVRGLSVSNRPVLCMTSGTPTSTSSMLGFADGSTVGYVKFENLDFTGYCDNNTSATKIGYLFNNNVLTTVSNLSFNNCLLHNFGNTPMRVQGGKNQVIDSLSYTGCKINDIGFSSTYAVVNSNSADFINTISFNNCIVYNFKGSLVLRTSQTLNSITITNCTINQGMQDPGSARYLIDVNNAVFQNGITIKNCILGSTGAAMGANGLRSVVGTPLSITGTYYTSDYVDDPIPAGATSTSIKSYMTSYSGSSATLWVDPVNGDFTLSDTSFPGKGVSGAIY